MKSSAKNIRLTSVDDLFSTEESRTDEQREKVQEIPLSELYPFPNHPFKVVDDERMLDTADSIREHGVLVPAIARPRADGGYELIAGHRRKRGCELAGLDTMPVIVRNLDDDASTIIMVDSNIQRESLLPSERAFAYKMKLEALNHQGKRSDLTCSQVGNKFVGMKSSEIMAEEMGTSKNQIFRYIRLTELVPDLLDMVDAKKIAFNPAVELSYSDLRNQVCSLLQRLDDPMTDIGLMPLFTVSGEQPTTSAEVDSPEIQEDTASDEQQPDTEMPDDYAELLPEQEVSGDAEVLFPDSDITETLTPEENTEGTPSEVPEDAVPDEQQLDTETPNDASELLPEAGELVDAAELLPVTDIEEILPSEENPDAPVLAAPSDYVSVTTDTRVLEYVNEYALEDYYCDGYLGQFVNDATVQVLSVTTDELGNGWYEVRFLYGDDFADGTMKWTDYATCWVMASETGPADSDACTVTDFAYSQEFLEALQAMDIGLFTTAMNGFSLKNINGSIGGFYAWQSSLYGSSGRDSAYPQIAKSASHGTIYATPHYLEGFTVYCLEHNLSGPGEGSGSNQTAKGPYVLVDMDYFVNNSGGGGVSGVRFSAKTMHALAWVLRHTYPFMALNRSDSNNEVWSRVAGQFAMREVIKQLEGSQYVRSYWDMDNFYAFSGGAPAVYLTYARWLAENGIARASITGKIKTTNQSLSVSDSSYIGTVTLTTDADLIRIPRSVGTLTGNSGGSDGSYYYIKSGDTIRVTSSSSRFAVSMESISWKTLNTGFSARTARCRQPLLRTAMDWRPLRRFPTALTTFRKQSLCPAMSRTLQKPRSRWTAPSKTRTLPSPR